MNLDYSLLVGGPMNWNVISVDIQDRWGRKNFKAADEFREIGLSVKERKSKALKKKVIPYRGERLKKVKIVRMTSSGMNAAPEINISCAKHST